MEGMLILILLPSLFWLSMWHIKFHDAVLSDMKFKGNPWFGLLLWFYHLIPVFCIASIICHLS